MNTTSIKLFHQTFIPGALPFHTVHKNVTRVETQASTDNVVEHHVVFTRIESAKVSPFAYDPFALYAASRNVWDNALMRSRPQDTQLSLYASAQLV
jgi:hypothetical protein